MAGLRVVGWNVRQGGGDRCPRIAAALVELRADVAVISEHRPNGRGRLEHCLEEAGFTHQVGGEDPDPHGHTGVLIAARVPIESGACTFDSQSDGHRFHHVRADQWNIVGCCIPGTEPGSNRKPDFWQFILDSMDSELRDEPTVLVGDLNTGLPYRDELGATLRCAAQMQELEARGWRDAWCERHPRARPPATWISPQYENPFRLDHALLSPVAPRARLVEYPTHLDDGTALRGTGALSDHSPVVVQLR